MTKTANFQNPRWRTGAILKIVKSPYLSEKSSDFDEIRHTTANGEPDCRLMTPSGQIFIPGASTRTSVLNFKFLAPLVTEIWRGSQNEKWKLLISPGVP